MQTFNNAAAASQRASVVTIGKFDGIHLGHQALIAKTVSQAKARQVAAVMVTFDRHPDAVLKPQQLRLPLIGPAQKQAKAKDFGIEVYLELPFTTELAAISGEEFAREVLVEQLHAQVVVVGSDFRFGRGGACDVAELKRLGESLGFEVETIEPVEVHGQKVSTSAIREALDTGDIKLANAMLGCTHTTIGLVEHGLKIGRTIGFPTANISRDAEGYLPRDGVYAGWLKCDGEVYPAAHSVGINETFQAVPRLVESHVIGRNDLDLYDKPVTLEYVDFIRPAAKFSGVEDLVEAINDDIAQISRILGI